MTRATLVSALLLGCASKSIPIGANPFGDGGSPGAGGWDGKGGAGGLDGFAGSAGDTKLGLGGIGTAGYGGGVPGDVVSGLQPDCAVQLASGDSHVCARYASGRVACLGENTYGQIGEPAGTPSLMLRTIPNAQATFLAAGGDYNCIASDKGIECWGDNHSGQLGTGVGIPPSFSPQPVLTWDQSLIDPTLQIVAGAHFACALSGFLHTRCWGSGTSSPDPAPVEAVRLGKTTQQFLVAGAGAIRMVDADRLFDVRFPIGNSQAPAVVRGASAGVAMNAIGADHDCILKRSGTAWCRGAGFFDFYTAVTELGSDLVDVKAGEGFTCALATSGEVRCLGVDDRNQLGDMHLTANQGGRRSRVATPIDAYAVEISLGRSHGCARMQDASVRCWGAFGLVSLGETSTVSQTNGCVLDGKRVWGEAFPVSRPADEYADSALAWAQERCRRESEADQLEACIHEATLMLNGCLQSLGASDSEYSACAGSILWNAAFCAADSSPDDASTIERCQPDIDAACGHPPRLVAFCARKDLSCGSSGTTLVPNDKVCDGWADCPDGFDEANCSPDADVFTCADGSTLPLDAFARGEVSCADGSGPD